MDKTKSNVIYAYDAICMNAMDLTLNHNGGFNLEIVQESHSLIWKTRKRINNDKKRI